MAHQNNLILQTKITTILGQKAVCYSLPNQQAYINFVESSEILHSASFPLLYTDRNTVRRTMLSWMHQRDAKTLKDSLRLMQISQQLSPALQVPTDDTE